MAAALNVAVLQLYYLVCTVFGGLVFSRPYCGQTQRLGTKNSRYCQRKRPYNPYLLASNPVSDLSSVMGRRLFICVVLISQIAVVFFIV